MDFFGNYDIEGMGIGAFGPVCLDRNSESYGKIGKSPKYCFGLTLFKRKVG